MKIELKYNISKKIELPLLPNSLVALTELTIKNQPDRAFLDSSIFILLYSQ